MWKKAPVDVYTSKSHCIFYQSQSLSTALVSLASFQKKKHGNNDQPFSLSHRIIPFCPLASTHRRRPHCALNPVAFVAAGHRGASRCDSAGILRRGALEGQSILTSLLSEHENHWLSDIFDCDNDGDGLRTCSKRLRIVMEHLSQSQVLTPTVCYINLFKLDLDKSQMQLANLWRLGILETQTPMR